jgi:hypothetical protein
MKITHLESKTEMKVIIELVNDLDYPLLDEEKYFFDWERERRNQVFKLKLADQDEILGLVSLIYFYRENRIEISLIAVSRENRGRNKIYDGIAGHLIAFVCRRAVGLFGVDACVSLLAKTELKNYYINYYGMIDAGPRVFLEAGPLNKLLERYEE